MSGNYNNFGSVLRTIILYDICVRPCLYGLCFDMFTYKNWARVNQDTGVHISSRNSFPGLNSLAMNRN